MCSVLPAKDEDLAVETGLKFYLMKLFSKQIALVYLIKTVWDYTFLIIKMEKNVYLIQTNWILKVIFLNTSFRVQDVYQVNVFGDLFEVYM